MQHPTFRMEQMIRNWVYLEELQTRKSRHAMEIKKTAAPVLELHRLPLIHAA